MSAGGRWGELEYWDGQCFPITMQTAIYPGNQSDGMNLKARNYENSVLLAVVRLGTDS